MDQYIKEMLDEWEQELNKRNMMRMYKTSKNYHDPRKKAFEEYCHHRKTKWIYCHECKYVRKQTTNQEASQKIEEGDLQRSLLWGNKS